MKKAILTLAILGFFKSTDHPPTNHRPPTNRPTDAVAIFKRLEQQDIHFKEHKHSWENIRRSSVSYLEKL